MRIGANVNGWSCTNMDRKLGNFLRIAGRLRATMDDQERNFGGTCILRMSRQGYGGQSQLQRFVGELIMTNTKWLRRALLGGVALTVMASSGARADELADLKAQLEA